MKDLIEFCPVCGRDIVFPERLFNLKEDNHVERCILPALYRRPEQTEN